MFRTAVTPNNFSSPLSVWVLKVLLRRFQLGKPKIIVLEITADALRGSIVNTILALDIFGNCREVKIDLDGPGSFWYRA